MSNEENQVNNEFPCGCIEIQERIPGGLVSFSYDRKECKEGHGKRRTIDEMFRSMGQELDSIAEQMRLAGIIPPKEEDNDK